MTWYDFRKHAHTWDESTQVAHIATLTSLGTSEEIVLVAMKLGKAAASSLALRAVEFYVSFVSNQIMRLAKRLNSKALARVVESSHANFTFSQLTTLQLYLGDLPCIQAGLRVFLADLKRIPENELCQYLLWLNDTFAASSIVNRAMDLNIAFPPEKIGGIFKRVDAQTLKRILHVYKERCTLAQLKAAYVPPPNDKLVQAAMFDMLLHDPTQISASDFLRFIEAQDDMEAASCLVNKAMDLNITFPPEKVGEIFMRVDAQTLERFLNVYKDRCSLAQLTAAYVPSPNDKLVQAAMFDMLLHNPAQISASDFLRFIEAQDDVEAASRLVNKAMDLGITFSPKHVDQLFGCVDARTLTRILEKHGQQCSFHQLAHAYVPSPNDELVQAAMFDMLLHNPAQIPASDLLEFIETQDDVDAASRLVNRAMDLDITFLPEHVDRLFGCADAQTLTRILEMYGHQCSLQQLAHAPVIPPNDEIIDAAMLDMLMRDPKIISPSALLEYVYESADVAKASRLIQRALDEHVTFPVKDVADLLDFVDAPTVTRLLVRYSDRISIKDFDDTYALAESDERIRRIKLNKLIGDPKAIAPEELLVFLAEVTGAAEGSRLINAALDANVAFSHMDILDIQDFVEPKTVERFVFTYLDSFSCADFDDIKQDPSNQRAFHMAKLDKLLRDPKQISPSDLLVFLSEMSDVSMRSRLLDVALDAQVQFSPDDIDEIVYLVNAQTLTRFVSKYSQGLSFDELWAWSSFLPSDDVLRPAVVAELLRNPLRISPTDLLYYVVNLADSSLGSRIIHRALDEGMTFHTKDVERLEDCVDARTFTRAVHTSIANCRTYEDLLVLDYCFRHDANYIAKRHQLLLRAPHQITAEVLGDMLELGNEEMTNQVLAVVPLTLAHQKTIQRSNYALTRESANMLLLRLAESDEDAEGVLLVKMAQWADMKLLEKAYRSAKGARNKQATFILLREMRLRKAAERAVREMEREAERMEREAERAVREMEKFSRRVDALRRNLDYQWWEAGRKGKTPTEVAAMRRNINTDLAYIRQVEKRINVGAPISDRDVYHYKRVSRNEQGRRSGFFF